MKMEDISLLKGIHPGIILERELKNRNLPKSRFALLVDEYPTIIGDITKAKRKMNTELALRIEHALGIEEGFFMILQAYYEIKEIKQKQGRAITPDLSVIRKSLFWDTDISTINWTEHRKSVIQRVFERGNDAEKTAITQFYGQPIIDLVLSTNTNNIMGA